LEFYFGVYNGMIKSTHRLIFCLALFSSCAVANNVENIFADATDYTVYIETRIEIPFIEDEAGVFLGTGFVVDAKRRWVMTNAHVIGWSPAEITVAFKDEEARSARLVYIDPYLDLAILQYDGDGSAHKAEANLECSKIPGVGHPVGAFGHPNGLKFTGTRGIISGVTANFGVESLQTDAPINGGNSGGPLISLESGRVVGISAAILSGEETQNANFAVIGQQACTVFELLSKGEDPRPVELGVFFYEIDDEPSLTVADVYADGEGVGLQLRDRIVGVGGDYLERETEGELLDLIRGPAGGTKLLIDRPGVGEVTLPLASARMQGVYGRRGTFVGGALFAESNVLDIGYLHGEPNVMVHHVAPGSLAESASLAPYDLIISANGIKITELNDLDQVIDSAQGEVLELEVLRIVVEEKRFTQHVLVELPVEDRQEIALDLEQPGE
jgi:serine protease Do